MTEKDEYNQVEQATPDEMPEPCKECAGCERESGCLMQLAWMDKQKDKTCQKCGHDYDAHFQIKNSEVMDYLECKACSCKKFVPKCNKDNYCDKCLFKPKNHSPSGNSNLPKTLESLKPEGNFNLSKKIRDLNEFELPSQQSILVEDKLRQEAIKWVKEDLRLCSVHGFEVLERWMKRLDITSEDLK